MMIMGKKSTLCQSIILMTYVIILSFYSKSITVVVTSTIFTSVTCVLCITSSEIDDDGNVRDGIVHRENVVVETNAIIIGVRDDIVTVEDEIVPTIQEQVAIEIDPFQNLNNIPQAIMIATVVPLRYY